MQRWGHRGYSRKMDCKQKVMGKEVRWCGVFVAEIDHFGGCEGHLKGMNDADFSCKTRLKLCAGHVSGSRV